MEQSLPTTENDSAPLPDPPDAFTLMGVPTTPRCAVLVMLNFF